MTEKKYSKYLMPPKEVSKNFGVGVNKIYQLIKTDPAFPVLKVGSKNLINTVLLEEYLDRATKEGRSL